MKFLPSFWLETEFIWWNLCAIIYLLSCFYIFKSWEDDFKWNYSVNVNISQTSYMIFCVLNFRLVIHEKSCTFLQSTKKSHQYLKCRNIEKCKTRGRWCIKFKKSSRVICMVSLFKLTLIKGNLFKLTKLSEYSVKMDKCF